MSIFDVIKQQGYYVIGEIGVNYYDIAVQKNITPMQAAKQMIFEAEEAGVDAVKFQTYKAETIASKFSPSYWDTSEEATTSQYELFKKFDSFGYEEYKELSAYCQEVGIEFFSTAFDFEAADYLNELMPIYKISSSDVSNLPFIEYQAQKGKPILLSTGASTLAEIHEAVKTIEATGNTEIVLLHCVLEYPTPYEHSNLAVIQLLSEEFPQYIIGYSDHTRPDENMDIIKTAVALGAPVIEKHFTLDKTLPGNDHYHAMDPADMRKLKAGLDFQMKIRGHKEINLDSQASARLNARRSIVLTQDVAAGTTLTGEMLTFKRPGNGISPAHVHEIVGRVVSQDIKADTTLTEDMLQ